MGLNKKLILFREKTALLVVAFLIFGCASQQKPQGGPRDRTPPKLVKATPPNMTRNFSAKQIRLDFDEYFSLKNPFQEITQSPTQEKAPLYKVSGKSIIVDFKDSLQKNTTYVINFGKAIADLNESNILQNFTYVFSTGNHIDSLSVSGNVKNILTQDKDKDVLVMLFPVKQDTLFGKKKPTIFTTTDSVGNFTLNNLHDGDYRIYALKEPTPNKIYDHDNELIAFLKEPIHLKKDTSNIHLILFQQEPEKVRVIEHRFDIDGKMIFTFNKGLENPSLRILSPETLNNQKIVEFSKTRDTALLYMRNLDFDSLKVSFSQNNKPLDTLTLRKGRKETYNRVLSLLYNISLNNTLKYNSSLNMTANLPLESIDNTMIVLKEDSTSITDFTISRDTGSLKKFTLNYKWKQKANYQLVFNEGALKDIYGDKNKKLIKQFQLDKPDNYGMLTLKMQVPDTSKGYVVELINEQKTVVHRDDFTKNTTLSYKTYPVGKYTVRVIYDNNRNKKWDSGNVKKRVYPENIWIYTKTITLRSNWYAEETIAIPKEPTNP